MAKNELKDFVCKPFCSFFREGVKEELICNGASLLEILMAKEMFTREEIEGVQPAPVREYERNSSMAIAICRKCPFRADDCDFQAESPPAGARPCGGYILLTLLARKGVVSVKKLKVIADG
jgi:hypothetical protein